MNSSPYDDDPFMRDIIERVQRASRAFKVLDEVEMILFAEGIRVELEGGGGND